MKITVAYLPEEERDAAATLETLRRCHPGVQVRRSEKHPPFKHIFLATKKPGKPCSSKEKVV